jgi:hypothetical protein
MLEAKKRHGEGVIMAKVRGTDTGVREQAGRMVEREREREKRGEESHVVTLKMCERLPPCNTKAEVETACYAGDLWAHQTRRRIRQERSRPEGDPKANRRALIAAAHSRAADHSYWLLPVLYYGCGLLYCARLLSLAPAGRWPGISEVGR